MAKNHMAEVAKMLGVELGEEFQISGKPKHDRFFISDEGLKLRHDDKAYSKYILLSELLSGEKEIVRRPWRPKKGERYWSVVVWSTGTHDTNFSYFRGTSTDIDCILMGNCFPTKKAAVAAAPDIVRLYQDVRKMVEEE